jgi:hypothetical protein
MDIETRQSCLLSLQSAKDRVEKLQTIYPSSPPLFPRILCSSHHLPFGTIAQFLTKATLCCLYNTLESNTSPLSLLIKSICKLFASLNLSDA